jgi:hypothetical protein
MANSANWRSRFDENTARTSDGRAGRMLGVKDAVDPVARNRFIFVALSSATTSEADRVRAKRHHEK